MAERRIEEGGRRREGGVVHEIAGQWEGAEGDGQALRGMLEAGGGQQLIAQVSAGLRRGERGEIDGFQELLKDSQFIVVGGIRLGRGDQEPEGRHRTEPSLGRRSPSPARSARCTVAPHISLSSPHASRVCRLLNASNAATSSGKEQSLPL